jgi:hypothetical protein
MHALTPLELFAADSAHMHRICRSAGNRHYFSYGRLCIFRTGQMSAAANEALAPGGNYAHVE